MKSMIKHKEERMFNDFSEIINIKDLCNMLHISKHTAYTLVKSGKLPAKRIGRIYRIRKLDVISFLSSN